MARIGIGGQTDGQTTSKVVQEVLADLKSRTLVKIVLELGKRFFGASVNEQMMRFLPDLFIFVRLEPTRQSQFVIA